MNRLIVGIDPGLDGAIVAVDANGLMLRRLPMPVVQSKGSKRNYDEVEIRRAMTRLVDEASEIGHGPQTWLNVVIEHVGAMPGQGVTSMFNFGLGFGLLRGICCGLSIPYVLVRPQAWQKLMLAGQPKGSEYLVASRTWPGVDWKKSDRCRKPHEGLVDAALIAEYGRRTIAV